MGAGFPGPPGGWFSRNIFRGLRLARCVRVALGRWRLGGERWVVGVPSTRKIFGLRNMFRQVGLVRAVVRMPKAVAELRSDAEDG